MEFSEPEDISPVKSALKQDYTSSVVCSQLLLKPPFELVLWQALCVLLVKHCSPRLVSTRVPQIRVCLLTLSFSLCFRLQHQHTWVGNNRLPCIPLGEGEDCIFGLFFVKYLFYVSSQNTIILFSSSHPERTIAHLCHVTATVQRVGQ